jgi:serine/threonine protein phosphatase PrpC
MFAELFLSAARPDTGRSTPNARFLAALDSANKRLQQHIGAGCISEDTGGTMLSVTVDGNRLRWLSVGDSPLYICRGNKLRRLNENHTMATQLDLLVRKGALAADTAQSHPHRHCLTSAVTGREIPRVDCPERAIAMEPGDVILLASDGLNVLEDSRICDLTRHSCDEGSAAIARSLLAAVHQQNAVDQDNISLVAIRIDAIDPAPAPEPARLGAMLRGFVMSLFRGLRPSSLAGFRPDAQKARP